MEGFEELAIDVDADDYAETAAEDVPVVSRTHQSEEQFQAIKASYSAKHDDSNSYADLLLQIPGLKSEHVAQSPIKLDKKQNMLLGYAAGELYYHKRYVELIDLCQAVLKRCHCDTKLKSSLERWISKCRDKMGG